jgi:hypothetical protein
MRVVHPAKRLNPFLALLFALGLSACASTASRDQAPAQWQYQGQKFGALRVVMSASVQVKLAEEGAFDLRRFEQTVLAVLEEQQLFDRRSGYSVTVEVTDVRLGPQPLWSRAPKAAGNVVTGKVTLKQPSGRPLYAFDVYASYALGDANAPAELLSGLYEEFAMLTVIQILSGSEPRSAYASL